MYNIKKREYTVAVINLGCKVNKYETDSMKKILTDAGFIVADALDAADFYIVNTCSVTNIAEKKSRQMLRRAKRRNPDAVVVAAGCYVNADKNALEKADYVDIVVGNNRKKNIADILNGYIESHYSFDDGYCDIGKDGQFEEMGCLKASFLDHQRAYIKIQDGCNQFCSYCIIPYTRGRVRSRKAGAVLSEIKELAAEGVKEFVLTGIHISSYGYDFVEGDEDNSVKDLADLLCAINDIAEVRRIRVSSLEPGIITETFLKKISGVKKLCPHFHLSLQSACNETLKRMNRRYTIEEFIDKCNLIRSYYDRPAITTDVIVGFPGETEEEFEVTYNNLRKIKLYEMHVFKYSPRRNTPAAVMEGQVDEIVKNIRSDRLIELSLKQKKMFEDSLFGMTDEVLIEEMIDDTMLDSCSMDIKGDGRYVFTGHTSRYVKVLLKNDNIIVNKIMPYTF